MEDVETEVKRGPGRPRLARADDNAPARKPIRERKRKGTIAQDKFAVSHEDVPDGWTYEWKRKSVYGASDPSYDVMLREQGFTPVPVERHPDMMPDGWKGAIERDGLVLMERPVELTEEARNEERASARLMVRHKEEQLGHAPAGTSFEHTARVSKHYEPISIDE